MARPFALIVCLALGCSGASELRLAREPAAAFQLGRGAETGFYREALWDDGAAETARPSLATV
jgi:hypothetical protein